MKKNKDKLKSSKTNNLSQRSQWLKRKDKTKKFCQSKEQMILNHFKKKRLHKNLKLKRWSKNSCLLKLFKKPKLLLLRKLLPKQTLPD